MEDIMDDEDRLTYDPGQSRDRGPKFRPTSAPRSFGNLRPHRPSSTENATSRVPSDGSSGRPSDQYKRDRPTSAPVIREDMEYRPPGQYQRQAPGQQQLWPTTRETFDPVVTEYIAEEQPSAPFDLDKHTLDIINELKTGKKHKSRPTSAPSRNMDLLGPSAGHRPLSAGIKRAKVPPKHHLQLPDSGAMRFLRKTSTEPPHRIFAPSSAPQSNATRFTPTWALTHRAGTHSNLNLEDSNASFRSDSASAMSVNRSLRPRSSQSAMSMRGSSPGPSQSGNFGPGYPEIPRGAVQNPLATKVGKTELREVNGSFEPLKSQIPAYDGLYDPFLREFWSRKNVGNVMRLTGHTRAEWAPDSGMFETAVSKELEYLAHPRDVRDALLPPPPPNPIPTPAFDPALPAGNVVSIEVSEEAVSVASEYLPLNLSQPVISAWLHWGTLPGQTQAADLDLSAVCFDCKARAIEAVFFRNLVGKHEAVVHLGDDSDAGNEEAGDEIEEGDDVARETRRKEGIVVHLARLPEDVQAVVFAVTCYSEEESGLSEAVGAEMRVSVGASDGNALETDMLRYYLSSERYNAAAPCMLLRDPRSASGWSVRTTPRVTVANVVVEMMPVLQSMLRESGACLPYLVQVEYCTARRPSGSLRGRKSDYTNSFKAVALGLRRIFPFIIVQGNPTDSPRVGSFEVTFVDGNKGRQLIWSKLKSGRWPKRMDTILNRITTAMQTVQVFYEIPDDRSVVEVVAVDADAKTEIPFAVVEVHALGLAAQKLQLETAKGSKNSKPNANGNIAGGKRLYRVQSDSKGRLKMRLPGGRYEMWGLAEGYDCEYPLEISVRPFSKFKLHARLALAPKDQEDE